MKNLMYLTSLVLLTLAFTACNNAPKGEKAVVSEAKGTAAAAPAGSEVYKVDSNSSITWTGSKPTGKHMGKLKISQGTLDVKNGNIVAGDFTIDMATNEVTDLQSGDGKEKLEGHLSAADFFHVEEFPTGSFTLTKAEAVSGNPNATHKLTGDLKLKDKVKSVTFDANVNIGPSKMTAVTPSFTINRTDWGINYKSGIINTAKDKLIHDEVGIVINLTASK
jgi:polyisoprenoid-binding protein YceI